MVVMSESESRKPLSIDVSFNRFEQIAKSDPGHQDRGADVSGHQPIGKIDRAPIRLDGYFSHRRTDMSHTTSALIRRAMSSARRLSRAAMWSPLKSALAFGIGAASS